MRSCRKRGANVTHLIKMSHMLANYIFGKTAKYDQVIFAHFQISLEMGTEICI